MGLGDTIETTNFNREKEMNEMRNEIDVLDEIHDKHSKEVDNIFANTME